MTTLSSTQLASFIVSLVVYRSMEVDARLLLQDHHYSHPEAGHMSAALPLGRLRRLGRSATGANGLSARPK